ncbi:MAG: hypothetical protein LAO08_00385 [Acidobacteriia bacterium]|nr:hypothetical protein [Terriglobia bacterium]
MAEQYADKRGPLITVIWPGYDRCDEEPLREIFHSAHDGTPEFEFASTKVASDESAFPDFLHEFANALREYQVKTLLDQIEAAEASRATVPQTTPPGPGAVKS